MFFDHSFMTITFLSLAEIYGDFAFRFYAQTNNVQYLAHGAAGYIGVVYFLIEAFRSKNVLYVNGMWDGVSAVVESVAAYFILGDRLSSPKEYAGIVLVILGIFLLKN